MFERFTGMVVCPTTVTSGPGVGLAGSGPASVDGATLSVVSSAAPSEDVSVTDSSVVVAVAVVDAGSSEVVVLASPSPVSSVGLGTKSSKPAGPVEMFKSVTVPDSRS